MAEDTITTEPVVVPEIIKDNPAQERITQLSDKVKETAGERDQALTKAQEAERRAEFAEGFVDIVITHPYAKDHKDEIKEKVLKGYSVQDATYAVLGAAGKLNGAAPVAAPASPAGGSAATTMPQGGQKSPTEMTQAERRAQLEKDLLWQ